MYVCVCMCVREREKLAMERKIRFFNQEVTGLLSTTAEVSLDMTVKI